MGALRRTPWAVTGEILEGEVRRGMVARGAGGFTAVVQGVEFVRRGGVAEQVALDLGSPEDPASEPAWLAALSALTELELVANGMGGTRAVG